MTLDWSKATTKVTKGIKNHKMQQQRTRDEDFK